MQILITSAEIMRVRWLRFNVRVFELHVSHIVTVMRAGGVYIDAVVG